MKNYSILTAIVSLPEQSTNEVIMVALPDNAIPVGMEVRPINLPNGIFLHYLIPMCGICGERPADFEGVMCYECKEKQDELNLQEERKSMAEEMVKDNHKGEQCWLEPPKLCLEGGWCSECQVFLNWKKEYSV